MFFPDRSCKVYIATGITDMRKSINGLALLVAGQRGLSPLTGSLFCFCNRQRTLIKILYWDRNGFCLWQKQLEKEHFRWPDQVEDVVLLHGSGTVMAAGWISPGTTPGAWPFFLPISGIKKRIFLFISCKIKFLVHIYTKTFPLATFCRCPQGDYCPVRCRI